MPQHALYAEASGGSKTLDSLVARPTARAYDEKEIPGGKRTVRKPCIGQRESGAQGAGYLVRRDDVAGPRRIDHRDADGSIDILHETAALSMLPLKIDKPVRSASITRPALMMQLQYAMLHPQPGQAVMDLITSLMWTLCDQSGWAQLGSETSSVKSTRPRMGSTGAPCLQLLSFDVDAGSLLVAGAELLLR